MSQVYDSPLARTALGETRLFGLAPRRALVVGRAEKEDTYNEHHIPKYSATYYYSGDRWHVLGTGTDTQHSHLRHIQAKLLRTDLHFGCTSEARQTPAVDYLRLMILK